MSSDLDALFGAARAVRAEPSPDLLARILSDAAREQPMPQPALRAVPVAPKPSGFGGAFGWVTGLADVLGGSRGLASLSLAGLTGLYLGIAQPAGVQSLTSLMSGGLVSGTTATATFDLLPADSTLWTED